MCFFYGGKLIELEIKMSHKNYQYLYDFLIICLEHTNFVHMLRNDCPFQVESGSLLYCLRLVSVFKNIFGNVVIRYLSFSTI